MYNRGDFEKAREFYREALQNDSSCVEALYNFGNNTNSLHCVITWIHSKVLAIIKILATLVTFKC